MFSQSVFQPQAMAALSQLSTAVNSMRQAGSVLVHPSNGRHSRVLGSSSRRQRTDTIDKTSSETVNKDIVAEECRLSVEECLEELLKVEERLSPLARSLILKREKPEHWRGTYTSAQTFFENKTGFTEHQLQSSSDSSFTLFLRHDVQKLLTSPLNAASYQQRRGFKTKKNIEKEERTILQSVSDMKTELENLTGRKRSSKLGTKTGVNNNLVDMLKSNSDVKCVYVVGTDGSGGSKASNFSATALLYLRILVLGTCLILLWRLMTANGGSDVPGIPPMSLKKMEINPEDVHVTFKDVLGVDEAKDEMMYIVEFLKNPEQYNTIGAKLPKGVLMVGSPGVGKTLLAKAIAGEAGVPFFHASGSEFDELFVGSGARKVRQLFTAAKARAPCLIFIDEIDSVGGSRTSSQLHPYANQTVNQLLSEMDGFSPNEGVIVIGATNKRDNLDSALLRPGRFDTEVKVNVPDIKGRIDIFKLYLSKVSTAEGLDYEKLGKMSFGMTGADIQNVVNQAALNAVHNARKVVTMEDLDFARDKVQMGPQWKNKEIDTHTNTNTAYHEAGHAIVAYFTKGSLPLHKVTILPRGHALGYTDFIPSKEDYGSTKTELLAKMDCCMGGRIGEEMRFGPDNVTTGASNDFKQATRIATMMVKMFGMSEAGYRVYEEKSTPQINTGNKHQPTVDSEIDRLLKESYNRAVDVLKAHSDAHRRLAEALLKYETLDKEDIEAVINNKPITRSPNAKPKESPPVKPIPTPQVHPQMPTL